MDKITNTAELFSKLDELKSIFQYGGKLIPVIQSIIDFMKDTVPLLEEINDSIIENTAKIPRASDQISNVTSATELATTEILDLVDSISNDIENTEEAIEKIIEKENRKSVIIGRFKELLKDTEEGKELAREYEEISHISPHIQEILKAVKKIKEDANNITLSLQVQDITTQQLAAVNHLIESVQKNLASLKSNLDNSELKDIGIESLKEGENITFDPNARYNKSAKRQDAVDEIVKDQFEKTSQEEIDKLFS
jgi:chemotaxis regulatin CheY-phosphate phosphatase CheZ